LQTSPANRPEHARKLFQKIGRFGYAAVRLKPAQRPEQTFLNENGLVVSTRALKVPDGRSFSWGSVSTLRAAKDGNLLTRLLFRERTAYRIFLVTKTDPTMQTVFETQDATLFARVQRAINQASDAVGGQREK